MSPTSPQRKTPRIVSTGFTTAFLGDERTLREFIVGDHVRKSIVASGENAVLYLVVDSYDPLNDRQLRIGVEKNEKLFRQFEHYCGRPLAEIPDPYGCHESYSDHFVEALLKRLHTLDIHPVVMDSYHAYRKGHYAGYIATTFERYSEIRDLLATDFKHVAVNALFRAQCAKCLCIDATVVVEAKSESARFGCKRCDLEWWQDLSEVRGKLTWKLDCAARWNLYGIDMEAFAKAHVAKQGTFAVAKVMSERLYGGKVPTVIKYGNVKISGEVSNRLIEILPPELLKRLFFSNMTRDLTLSREFVENFCHKTTVRPGLTYTDYVRRQLPVDVLREESQNGSSPSTRAGDGAVSDHELVAYGTRFGRFYYGRDYGARLPRVQAFESIDPATAETALRLVRHAVSVRSGVAVDEERAHGLIQSFVREQQACPEVYQFLRRVFGCEEGPHITTLLTIISKDYLRTVELVLSNLAWNADEPRRAVAKAAGRPAAGEPDPEAVTKIGVKR